MYKEKGIPVYLHEADNAAMGDPELNLSSDLLETMTFPEADHLIREGDRLSLAGLDIEVLHTPGHTPGSVCFRIGDDLFSGDTLFRLGYGRVDFPGGNVSDMAASLKRLKQLPGQTRVYPGHGGPTTIAREQW
jgi:glyoxylase-like metal-dependent hydrolase (beta-lactamase superfamily II)